MERWSRMDPRVKLGGDDLIMRHCGPVIARKACSIVAVPALATGEAAFVLVIPEIGAALWS